MASFSEVLDVGSMADGGNLFGRPVGQQIHGIIADRLDHLPRAAMLLVDLRAVLRASPSALREVVSILSILRGAEFEDRYLLFRVELANQELVESLEMVARDQGSVLPIVDTTGGWHVLGRLTKGERDTLALVLEREEVTSTELSKRFQLGASAASNRLRRLYGLRLVQRKERLLAGSGGREFVYRPLIARK